MNENDWRQQHVIFEELLYSMMDCCVPLIAAVNGKAYGGGLELALCCDFIVASANAEFALPEVAIGIMPGGTGTQNLPRAVGARRAKQLIFSAKSFSAEDAYRWGLVNEICEPNSLLAHVKSIALRICEVAPIAVQQAKKAISYGLQMDIRSAVVFEVEAYQRVIATEDRLEGVRAFNEKRKPTFKGR
jgi:enoyl-CoA hydratase/carnithine racemase